MKIHILSDLHLEFGAFQPPVTEADVVVLAGDIHVGTAALAWIAENFTTQPVIYVPGNHEFYHHSFDVLDALKSQAPDNCHVLNNDAVVINGVRFLGAVLWTDFELEGEDQKYFAMDHAAMCMNDFEVIEYAGQNFTPQQSAQLHAESRQWITDQLSMPFAGKTVVVSHHVPSEKSVAGIYQNNSLNPAFVSNLEPLMDERIALWIHGHTHDAFDYYIDKTRVICNPRGYERYESNNKFNSGLVVDI